MKISVRLYTSNRMVKVKKTGNTQFWKGCGTRGTLPLSRNTQRYSHFGRVQQFYFKKLNIQLHASLVLLNNICLEDLKNTPNMKTCKWVFLSVSDRVSLCPRT